MKIFTVKKNISKNISGNLRKNNSRRYFKQIFFFQRRKTCPQHPCHMGWGAMKRRTLKLSSSSSPPKNSSRRRSSLYFFSSRTYCRYIYGRRSEWRGGSFPLLQVHLERRSRRPPLLSSPSLSPKTEQLQMFLQQGGKGFDKSENRRFFMPFFNKKSILHALHLLIVDKALVECHTTASPGCHSGGERGGGGAACGKGTEKGEEREAAHQDAGFPLAESGHKGANPDPVRQWVSIEKEKLLS